MATSWKKEVSDLASFLSGEEKLRDEQRKLEKAKKEEVKKQKIVKREKIVKGEERIIPEEDVKKVIQNIKLFEWEAPIRFKYPIEIKTFLAIVALFLIFIVYLAVLGNYALMAALIALLFFIYVLGTTKPVIVKHRITSRGIESLDTLYEYFMLSSFWFTKRNDEYMLSVDTKLRFPGRLLLLVKEEDVPAIFVLLQDKLIYKDIRKQGFLDIKNYGEYIKIEDIKIKRNERKGNNRKAK